jgi:hypothetical protein
MEIVRGSQQRDTTRSIALQLTPPQARNLEAKRDYRSLDVDLKQSPKTNN